MLAIVALIAVGFGLYRGWGFARFVGILAGLWALGAALLLAAPGQGARLTGAPLRVWLVAGGAIALALGYVALLRLVRKRTAPMVTDAPKPKPAPMSDVELERYARHIVLREVGGPGQQAMRRARVLVIGAGGLGAPACLYLAAAGVGRITVADDDHVSLSNLQRQVLFRDADLGRPKAATAAGAMQALNPHVTVTPHPHRVTESDAALIAEHDLVLDGTDSFAARAAINRACAAAGVPLIAGAIAQWEGQVTVYDPARGAPCLACIFPQIPARGLAPACAEAGVVGALPGVIGSIMALEAIKLITGAGQPLRGRMLIFDGLWGETRTLTLTRRSDCPVCSGATRPA